MSPNPFEHFWKLGFHRLIPIVPHDAKISERSTLFKRVGTKQDGRGKTPGIKGRDGSWSGMDWLPYQADAQDLTRWNAMGAGVGIKLGAGLVAIDADTLDPQLAQIVYDTIVNQLGALPVRIGQKPKALYLCRIAGQFQYARVEFGNRDDKDRLLERVEILSEGRQFVAYGTHPKTKQPYTWPKSILAHDDLPIFQPEQLTRLLETLRQKLPQAAPIIREGGTTEISQDALKGPLETVRKAVAAIPNTSALFPSRESYRDMGYAIKAALPDDEEAAFDIWADWCARWADGENEPDVIAADWKRMKPPYRRGASWLYELAEQHSVGSGAEGDEFTRAEVWFDVLPEETASPFEIQERAERATAGNGELYRVLGVTEILDRPPPRWLVARHLPLVGMGFLYSEPGVGKSFLALDMALHIAYGRAEWHGDAIDAGTDTAVLYLAAEGSYGFRNRIKAWLKQRGRTGETGDRFKLIEQTVNFMEPADIERLERTVTGVVGLRPCLIVVDTVSRAMPGADENLQKEMTLFVRACDRLRDRFGCVVLGVHHAGKSGDMRGSTVLLGAGDFVFRLSRKKGATVGHLGCEKQKDGPDGWDEPYRFETVGLGEGETSLLVTREEIGFGGGGGLSPGVTRGVLEAMGAAWASGEPWSKNARAGERYAVKRMVADFGFDGDTAEETLRMWEASGFISMSMADSKSRRTGYKVAVDPGQIVRSDDVFA